MFGIFIPFKFNFPFTGSRYSLIYNGDNIDTFESLFKCEIRLEISKKYCKGNVVSILEGGYDLQALAESSEEHVKALSEFENK